MDIYISIIYGNGLKYSIFLCELAFASDSTLLPPRGLYSGSQMIISIQC